MPDPIFPNNIKPIVSKGYSFKAPDNVIYQPIAGGLPLTMLKYLKSSVEFNVVLILNSLQLQVWNDFYFAKIFSGSAPFVMVLDSGNGLENHNVTIVPNSINQTTIDGKNWTVIFTIFAESTPSQDKPFEGNLSDLYSIYGEGLIPLLNRVNVFALEDLPEVF